jgi:hypothetical protein
MGRGKGGDDNKTGELIAAKRKNRLLQQGRKIVSKRKKNCK